MEDAFDSIDTRRWNLLQSTWRSYLPYEIAELPKCFRPLSDDELIVDQMNGLQRSDAFTSIGDYPKLRTKTFEIARFSMERSLYFLTAAETLVSSGRPTACLTASYLSSFFGARAITAFLGVSYCFFKSDAWLIDCYPGASKVTSQGRPRQWRPDVLALVSNKRIGHEHHWKLFIRMRSITLRLPMGDTELGVLRRLKEHSSFSERRNDLQYNDRWPLADLMQPLLDENFGILDDNLVAEKNDNAHDVKLAQIITLCAVSMAMDVLRPLAKHAAYVKQLKSRLALERHPLVSTGYLARRLEQLAS